MSETVYAKVIRVRMQVGGFTKNPKAVNTQNNILVDLTDHPQKDEVQKDWFYNEATNTFSPDGEVFFPEAEEPERVVTNAELEAQNAELQVQNETLMLALAEQYEKQLVLEENQNTMMLAIAELYETSIANNTPTEGSEE